MGIGIWTEARCDLGHLLCRLYSYPSLGDVRGHCLQRMLQGDREEPCGLCGILLGPSLSINTAVTDTKVSHTTLSPSANETEIKTLFTTSGMKKW